MKNTFFNQIKPYCFYLCFIAVFSLIMVLLLWGAYAIPMEKIRANGEKSFHILRQVNHNVPSFHGLAIDKFTDALILNNAVSVINKDKLSQALLVYRANVNMDQDNNLRLSLSTDNIENVLHSSYGVFWHGYLIFLKPLLYVFDLNGIRFINLILQLGLLLTICYLIYKRLSIRDVFSYLMAICFINPVTSWMCLEYMTDVNIMLLASLLVLLNKNKDNDRIFFMTGAITTAFDFLTFPLITLGIPLILHVALYKRGFKDNIKCVIKNALLWVFGYGLMMFMKWGIATLLTDENIIIDGWRYVLHRTFDSYEFVELLSFTPFHAIGENLVRISHFSSLMTWLLFVVLLGLSYFIWPYRIKINTNSLIFLGIACMPFVWYSVLINHSIVHPHWTYKILAVSMYGLAQALVCLLKPVRDVEHA